MSVFMISQLLVGVALIFDLLSFQFKNRKYILLSIAAACFFMAAHFMLLDHWTAACLMWLSTFRYFVSGYTTSKKWMYFFLIATVIGTAWTYSGYISFVSFGATFVLTLAAFCETDKRLREVSFLGVSLWIIHNILVGSPSAIALESLFLMSNAVGYYRYYIRKPIAVPCRQE